MYLGICFALLDTVSYQLENQLETAFWAFLTLSLIVFQFLLIRINIILNEMIRILNEEEEDDFGIDHPMYPIDELPDD